MIGMQRFSFYLIICIVFLLTYIYIPKFWWQIELEDYIQKQISPIEVISPSKSKAISKDISSRPDGYSFTIVTAASSNHWCQLTYWISHMNNLKLFLPKNIKSRIIIYDLNLKEQHKFILDKFKSKNKFNELRKFNYTKYPEFWNLKENKTSRGEYGWKAGIIKEISNEFPGFLIWSDSGTIISQKTLENLPEILKLHNGFISSKSSGTMAKWTHPGVYKYFNDDAKKYKKVHNCNAASLFFDTNRTQYLIDALYECALEKECIAPRGSSRKNHRQDQAILTYLITKDRRKCEINDKKLGAKAHGFDHICRDDKKIAKDIEAEDKKHIKAED